MDTLLDLIPGSRILDGWQPPSDPDAAVELPYGDHPPLEWFTTPHHDVIPGATGLITADGRFCAYSHEWDRCHNGFTSQGECWTPPPSVTENRYFHQSSIVTAEGVQIPVGVIPLGEGHAPIDVDIYQAMAHYDRPERVRVRARAVETPTGVVMCGALVPGTTHAQVAVMRAAALSGDWRWVPELGAMEFLGPCFVARPGLPIGLEQAALSQALWSVTRELETTVAADGRVMAAMTIPVGWSPREAIVANVPPAVIAAAQLGDPGMSGPNCTCQKPTTAPQAAPEAAPAAAGSTEASPVTAHASEAAGLAELTAQVADLSQVIEALASDVARISAQSLEPADLVAEMVAAP